MINKTFAENFSGLSHEEPKKPKRITQTRVKVKMIWPFGTHYAKVQKYNRAK